MVFYRVRSSFDTRRDRDLHPILSFDDREARFEWQEAVRKATSEAEALAVQAKFVLEWGGSRRQKEAGLSDWPSNLFAEPVCSQRLWARARDLCDSIWWTPLPESKEAAADEWGVLWRLPLVDLDSPQPSLPHLFKASHKRAAMLIIVSEAFKEKAEAGGLHGVEFTPFNAELGRDKAGWRCFLEY